MLYHLLKELASLSLPCLAHLSSHAAKDELHQQGDSSGNESDGAEFPWTRELQPLLGAAGALGHSQSVPADTSADGVECKIAPLVIMS